MRGVTHGGKGSGQRPVNKSKFEENHDKIFGKKEKVMEYQPEEVRTAWEESGDPFEWATDTYQLYYNATTGEHKHYNVTTDEWESF